MRRFLPRFCARRSHARAQERMCAQMDEEKQREAAALPIREGCFVCGGVIVSSGTSVPRPLAPLCKGSWQPSGWLRDGYAHSCTATGICNPSVTAQSAVPPPLTQGRHRRTAIFSPCGRSAVWRCRPLKGDGLKNPQQIPRKRKTPLPERTNRQGRFHRRNGVGKRNYHVAWGRDCVFCQRAGGSCAVTKIPACYLTVPII